MISDHVTFSSSQFAVEPGEDAETNPGIYGRALAGWIAEHLNRNPATVEVVVAEDFGRCVMIRTRPFKLWVTCSSLDGSRTRWQMFIALEQSLIARVLRRVDPEPDVDRLRTHLRAVVAEVPDARDVEWEAH